MPPVPRAFNCSLSDDSAVATCFADWSREKRPHNAHFTFGRTEPWRATFQIEDNFPDGFGAAVGDVVVAFGRLEYVLYLCYKSLRGEGFEVGMAEIVKRGRVFTSLCKEVEAPATEERLPEPHRSELPSNDRHTAPGGADGSTVAPMPRDVSM